MIKIPEKAPDWRTLKNHKDLFKFLHTSEAQALIQKTDDRYYYWDKIRSQPFSGNFSKKEIWAFLRFRRFMNSNISPITDVNGNAFMFWLTDKIQKNLHLIDQSTSGNLALNDPGQNQKTTAKYIVTSLMEEAITSSQIEGAVATIKDAKKMLMSNRRPKNTSEQMIYNNFNTMQSLKNCKTEPLSINLLLKLHASITKDTLDDKEDEGKIRTSKDIVNVVNSYGDILFTPPKAEELHTRLVELCKFANDNTDKPFIHPVVKAIMLHFWLAYIHPFTDGNGRLARTLFYWYLLKHKYWLFEYTSISKIILKKTTQYGYSYLYSENDDNDLTYFINFNIDVIMDAVEDLKNHIQKEQEKNYQARQAIAEHPSLNIRQTRIIQHVALNPSDVLTIKFHQKLNNVSYQTARTDLLNLSEEGWLKTIHKGKTFYFVASENFSEKLQNN